MSRYGERLGKRLNENLFGIPRDPDVQPEKRLLASVSRDFGLAATPDWPPPAITTLAKNILLASRSDTFNPDRLVSGPKIVTTHEMGVSTVNGRHRLVRWHVFGEKHGFENSCPKDDPRTVSIEKYLSEMAIMTTVFFFFFIEMPIRPEDIPCHNGPEFGNEKAGKNKTAFISLLRRDVRPFAYPQGEGPCKKNSESKLVKLNAKDKLNAKNEKTEDKLNAKNEKTEDKLNAKNEKTEDKLNAKNEDPKNEKTMSGNGPWNKNKFRERKSVPETYSIEECRAIRVHPVDVRDFVNGVLTSPFGFMDDIQRRMSRAVFGGNLDIPGVLSTTADLFKAILHGPSFGSLEDSALEKSYMAVLESPSIRYKEIMSNIDPDIQFRITISEFVKRQFAVKIARVKLKARVSELLQLKKKLQEHLDKKSIKIAQRLCKRMAKITSDLENSLFFTDVTLLDAYALALAFSVPQNNSGGECPNRVDNAVVYVGNLHAEIIRAFLKENGFRETFRSAAVDDRCVDMTGFDPYRNRNANKNSENNSCCLQ